MAEKADRGQWTIKSRRVDAELQNACRMAAERQGMSLGDWCAESLLAAAHAILKADGGGTPGSTPPARIEDVAADLTARMGEMFGTLAQQQTERLARIERAGRRGRWRR